VTDGNLATVLDAANDFPVVVGLAGNNASDLREQALELNKLPLSGILVSAPYYVRPSQAGLLGHFTSLADVSTHPVVLYNIPYRTGVVMATETLLTLAAHPNIVAVKDCGGSLEKTLALILDGRLSVLAGEDLGFFSSLCLGGSGAIAASAHLQPDNFVATYRAVKEGNLAEGRRLFHRLVPLIEALGSEPNPGPVKRALANLGVANSEVRAPMTEVSDVLRVRLESVQARR
jgi:4-hydroxy-tetrahydrodipicolinate synthase